MWHVNKQTRKRKKGPIRVGTAGFHAESYAYSMVSLNHELYDDFDAYNEGYLPFLRQISVRGLSMSVCLSVSEQKFTIIQVTQDTAHFNF